MVQDGVANTEEGERRAKQSAEAKAQNLSAKVAAPDEEQLDAYQMFNPFGGAYKGFHMSNADEARVGCAEDAVPSAAAASSGPVKFRKRRKGKKQQRRRGGDD